MSPDSSESKSEASSLAASDAAPCDGPALVQPAVSEALPGDSADIGSPRKNVAPRLEFAEPQQSADPPQEDAVHGAYGASQLPSRLLVPREASRILLVRGMGAKPDSEVIYREFGAFGSIQEVRVATDPKHGELTIVVFDDVLSAFAAHRKLHGMVLNGRNLRIKFHQIFRRHLIA